MRKFKIHHQGQSLIGIIIVLVVVGLVSGGLYYYLSKQIPEMPEIAEKPAEEAKPEVTEPKVTCQNECSPAGSKRCSNNSYQICGNYDNDPCLEWGLVINCPANTICQNGICVAQKCTDGTLYGQCSTNKPMYCDNGNLINRASLCGCTLNYEIVDDNCVPQEKVTTLGKKTWVLYNGSPSEKLDLLFIPSNISNFSTLRSKLNDILYKSGTDINGEPMVSLFNIEPFKSYKNRFNVAYVNKNINESLFGCWKEESDPTKPPQRLHFLCNDDKIKEEYKIFEPDYIIVVFNEADHYTSSGGEIQYLNINLESSSRFATLSWTFVHEFGHQFGGLADEYVTTGSPSRHCGTAASYTCFENYKKALEYYPNLDTLGCPKWCQSYDLNKDEILMRENNECGEIKNQENCRATLALSCTWFDLKHPFFNTHCVSTQGVSNIGINCEGDTICAFGGDYGQLAFNPGPGIMGGGTKFNKPFKEHLESILDCCYPRKETSSCQNFRNQFQNIPASASILPDLREAFNKISSCP